MSEPVLKKQRIRSKNFSLQEVEVLKNQVKTNINIINAKHCNGASGVTKQQQDKVWVAVTERVNAVGVAKRSVYEIKEKWRNLTKKAKTEVTSQKTYMARTGGGPAPPPFSDPVIEDIADLYAASAGFHGIPGALDAESIIFSLSEFAASQEKNAPGTSVVDEQGDHSLDENDNNNNTWPTASAQPPSPGRGLHSANDTTRVTKEAEVTIPKQSVQTNPPRREDKKTVKDLQIEFYTVATENQKKKAIVLQQQEELCKQQKETLLKINSAIDVLLSKFMGNK